MLLHVYPSHRCHFSRCQKLHNISRMLIAGIIEVWNATLRHQSNLTARGSKSETQTTTDKNAKEWTITLRDPSRNGVF